MLFKEISRPVVGLVDTNAQIASRYSIGPFHRIDIGIVLSEHLLYEQGPLDRAKKLEAFLTFRADRAFYEGMKAYRHGQPNQSPAKYCEHSTDWVRGWNAAWLAMVKPAQLATEKIEPAQPVGA